MNYKAPFLVDRNESEKVMLRYYALYSDDERRLHIRHRNSITFGCVQDVESMIDPLACRLENINKLMCVTSLAKDVVSRRLSRGI